LRDCCESNCGAIQSEADAIPITSRTADIPNGAGFFIAFLALLMTPFAAYAVAVRPVGGNPDVRIVK